MAYEKCLIVICNDFIHLDTNIPGEGSVLVHDVAPTETREEREGVADALVLYWEQTLFCLTVEPRRYFSLVILFICKSYILYKIICCYNVYLTLLYSWDVKLTWYGLLMKIQPTMAKYCIFIRKNRVFILTSLNDCFFQK